MAGLKAFQEAFLVSETLNFDEFYDYESRRVRYEIFWSQYENTAYREVHSWVRAYKTDYALYRYIRNIYNPAYRLGEFWKTYLWGGQLSPVAGSDGALPIMTDNEKLRPAIASVWDWSNWDIRKDIITLGGSVMGDVFLKIIDNPDKGKVYIETVHPGLMVEVVKDAFGFIKAYRLEEERAHPESVNRTVTYTETAERGVNQDVIFRTYLNNAPYAWNGVASEWTLPYGFIPMVHIKHNDIGMDWGWSELHPSRSKMHELDDVASMISDRVRQSTRPKWLFAGIKEGDPTFTATAENVRGYPEPGREEERAMVHPDPQVKATALVADVDIAGSVEHVQAILEDLERDYPELKFDSMRASGELSGTALRIARQPATSKVLQRRANYDSGLVRAQQMAVAIGGYRDLFPGFGLDSYAAGDLDHFIGERPVFAMDAIELLEEDAVFWEVAKVASEAGLPLVVYLKRQGWTDEEIAEIGGIDGV